jgi:hypothetical protein
MSDRKFPALKLRAGDLVEVRSEQEILTTLDEQGAIDGMPFMPEMLEYCGRQFRVAKRADKTCDTITLTGLRRLQNTVHLEGLRCSGAAHEGCQAYCFLFWNEAWLKRADRRNPPSPQPRSDVSSSPARVDRARLQELTRQPNPSDTSEQLYRCQATDLLKCSKPLSPWDVRQYARDVFSGNIGVSDLIKAFLFRLFQRLLSLGPGYRAKLWLYNRLQSACGGSPYPYLRGALQKTPRQKLDIQPGELVKIKTYEGILATLNAKNQNQGLNFDAEMVPYCGSVRRVLARVEHIIDDRTRKMIHIPSDCLLLEGTVCKSKYGDKRLFCPRTASAYWREIWVERVSTPPAPSEGDSVTFESGSADQFQVPHQG